MRSATDVRAAHDQPTLLDHIVVFVVTLVTSAAATFIFGVALLARL